MNTLILSLAAFVVSVIAFIIALVALRISRRRLQPSELSKRPIIDVWLDTARESNRSMLQIKVKNLSYNVAFSETRYLVEMADPENGQFQPMATGEGQGVEPGDTITIDTGVCVEEFLNEHYPRFFFIEMQALQRIMEALGGSESQEPEDGSKARKVYNVQNLVDFDLKLTVAYQLDLVEPKRGRSERRFKLLNASGKHPTIQMRINWRFVPY